LNGFGKRKTGRIKKKGAKEKKKSPRKEQRKKAKAPIPFKPKL